MAKQTQSRAATVAPAPAMQEQEQQLREALAQGSMGIGGAIASFSNLSIQQIVAIASEVTKERRAGKQ